MADLPGPPKKPVVKNLTAESCDVEWQAPSDDGGSPIINYVLEKKLTSETEWTVMTDSVLAPNISHHVTGLRSETEYQFRVSAVNKAGQGKPSEPSDITKYCEYYVI